MNAKRGNTSLPRRSQQERRAKAADALLDAAAELIAACGVTGTSLADIGARAGRSRGLASHHFGSKARLVEQFLLRSQHRFLRRFLSATPETGLAAVLQLADVYLESFFDPTAERRAFVVIWGSTFPRESTIPALAHADERGRSIIAGSIARGREDGSISSDVDEDAAAFVILALLRGVAAQLLTRPDTIKLQKVRTECRRLLLGGLSPQLADDGRERRPHARRRLAKGPSSRPNPRPRVTKR